MTGDESQQFEKLFDEKIHRLEAAINHVKELKVHDLAAAEQSRADMKELMTQRFAAYDRALTEAKASLAEYKAQANEWRGQSKDQSERFMPRAEALGRINGIDAQIAELQNFRNQESGKDAASAREKNREGRNVGFLVAIALAIMASAIAVVSIILRK